MGERGCVELCVSVCRDKGRSFLQSCVMLYVKRDFVLAKISEDDERDLLLLGGDHDLDLDLEGVLDHVGDLDLDFLSLDGHAILTGDLDLRCDPDIDLMGELDLLRLDLELQNEELDLLLLGGDLNRDLMGDLDLELDLDLEIESHLQFRFGDLDLDLLHDLLPGLPVINSMGLCGIFCDLFSAVIASMSPSSRRAFDAIRLFTSFSCPFTCSMKYDNIMRGLPARFGKHRCPVRNTSS